MKALITTVPFGDKNRRPLDHLDQAGVEYVINPLGRKLKEGELTEMVSGFDIIIAGTEQITAQVMDRGSNLKMISRVGIGLDGVDLIAAQERGIQVCYTPDAPSSAVAELTVGMMLSLLRSVHVSNAQMHQGGWQRIFGRRISEVNMGIVGLGRIGSQVLELLSSFKSPRLMVNDLLPNPELDERYGLERVSKETLYREADIISLHLPLTAQTKNMISRDHLEMMKPDAVLINTSRGGIINEQNLYEVMMAGHLAGAAIDVFEQEPYQGGLRSIERCLLTAHMGSMSVDCRTRMEIEATEEAVRFYQGKPLQSVVPDEEYAVQRQKI